MTSKIWVFIITIVLVCICCCPTNYVETPETTTSEITTTSEPTTTTVEVATTQEKESTTVELETTTKKTTTTEHTTLPENIYSVPNVDTSFKSWTNYRMVSKSSPQWNRILCNENAYTDDNGLRKVDEYYCVAMGSYYTETLGDLFEIQTSNGSFKVIICDFKADIHTNISHQYTLSNKCMTEFYVDISNLNSKIKQMGDVSYASNEFQGRIINVIKIGNYFD